MLLSSTHHLVLSRSCSFLCLSIQPDCRPLFSSSSHSVKFCLSSQSECCPNYIIFILSLSCFKRSVVIIDLYCSLYISLLPECLHVLLVHCITFCCVFQPTRFSYVPCSSFITECFQLCSSSLYSLFLSICSTCQGSLVSLICQRSNLVLPLLFLFRFPSGAILDLGTRSSRSGGVL